MKAKIVIALIVLSTALCTQNAHAQKKLRGNRNVVKELRITEPFNGIEVQNGLTVYLTQNDTAQIFIETDENLQENIITRVQNGILVCSIYKPIRRAKELNLYITTPDINKIKAIHGSEVICDTLIETNTIEIEALDNALVKAQIETEDFTCTIKDKSDIIIKGKSSNFECEASNNARLNAQYFRTQNATFNATNKSNIEIIVSNEITITATNKSAVTYFGKPKPINIYQSGGSKVKQRRLR